MEELKSKPFKLPREKERPAGPRNRRERRLWLRAARQKRMRAHRRKHEKRKYCGK